MDSSKPFCFVIQEFDGGTFDLRYKETIMPALNKAGVDPKRADEILGLQPIIQKIEDAIEQADICIAEVSKDNPNVFLELGYALALNKPVVILCDKDFRQKLPFDIQHRPVIFYRTNSKSGYDDLEIEIIKYTADQLQRAQSTKIKSPILSEKQFEDIEEFKDYEVSILLELLSLWPSDSNGSGIWSFGKRVEDSGFSEAELALGLLKLMEKEMIKESIDSDFNGNEFKIYQITPLGIAWINKNEEKINLKVKHAFTTINEDEIPF